MKRRNCVVCGRFFSAKYGGGRLSCLIGCAEKRSKMLMEERHPGYAKAHQAVYRAVKRGALPRLDGTVDCVDCGAAAKHYDHRDYSKPLEVEPVCARCNRLRGSAIGRQPNVTPRRTDLRPEWFR